MKKQQRFFMQLVTNRAWTLSSVHLSSALFCNWRLMRLSFILKNGLQLQIFKNQEYLALQAPPLELLYFWKVPFSKKGPFGSVT